MKIRNILLGLFIGAAALTSCNKNADTKSPETSTGHLDIFGKDSLTRFMPLNFDLDKYSYEELRVLKNYVYARHGHWFQEFDLNSYFTSLGWYSDLIDSIYFKEIIHDEGWREKRFKNYDKAYWKLWETNYKATFDKVKLTDEEKAFIEKINNKIAELRKEHYIKDEDGVEIYNSDQIVDYRKLFKPDKKLPELLHKCDFAIEGSNCDQLFNIYEENDYTCMTSFVTTDLILQAYNKYFAYTLKSLEKFNFLPAMKQMTTDFYKLSMANSKSAQNKDEKELAEYAATYYAIALRLEGEKEKLEIPASQISNYNAEISNIESEANQPSPFLETGKKFIYPLFKPRGNYTHNDTTKAYFKSMMWLQSAYFCLDDPLKLKRALYISLLFNQAEESTRKACMNVYDPLTFLMGEPDNLSIVDISKILKTELKINNVSDLLNQNKLVYAQKVLTQKFHNKARITNPKAESCTDQINFMPGRYTPDNEILCHMADPTPNCNRPIPHGLDVFNAYGCEEAQKVLDEFYSKESWSKYNDEMNKMRKIFAHPENQVKTMYNKWIETVIAMQETDKRQPKFMQTKAWRRKNLNTGLASWAELKHNSILYAKQPMMAECGGGDEDIDQLPEPKKIGFVEPNMQCWTKLKEMLNMNVDMLKNAGFLDDDLKNKAEELGGYVDFCRKISQKELNGETLTSEDVAGIDNLGNSIEWYTLSIIEPGEYHSRWEDVDETAKKIACIADIYTRNVVGCGKCGILYEGVGNPNIIYTVIEVDGEFHIARGATFSYYEFVKPAVSSRLTDEEWLEMLKKQTNPGVPDWMKPYRLDKTTEINAGYEYSSGC